ncbi:MAG: hypothetical protein CL833_00615, partial [Crocinitomicaceae bacterium]|nr:hypothetical protein [Crocinitomicaceae bacterium]
WATNFIGFILVSNDWGAIQTDTLIKNIGSPSVLVDVILPTALLPLIYLIFSKMYKWRKISMLFEKIELPIAEEGEDDV